MSTCAQIIEKSLNQAIFFIVHKLRHFKKACVHPWYHKIFNNNCVNANNIKQTCLIDDSAHFNAQIYLVNKVLYIMCTDSSALRNKRLNVKSFIPYSLLSSFTIFLC